MGIYEISFYAAVSGALGGIAAHISWLIKASETLGISDKKNLISKASFRSKLLILSVVLGALIGWVCVIFYSVFYGLGKSEINVVSQILAVGFLSAFLRQNLSDYIKGKI